MTNNLTPGAAGAKRTKSVVGLVLGIVALLFAFLLNIIGAIIGVVAIIFSVLGRRSEPAGSGLALGGLITGIIAVVIGVILFIVGIIAVTSGVVPVPAQ